MTTQSNLLITNNNRFLKFMKITLVLMATLIGLIVLGSAGLLLLTRTNVIDLMSTVLGISSKTPWHLSRSAGTVAYLLLASSTIWGLLLSTKIVKEAIPAAFSLAMHNVLSLLALVFTGFHALVLLFDSYYTYTLSDLTIPFIGPYRPVWVGLGIVGFYLMVLGVVLIGFGFRLRGGLVRGIDHRQIQLEQMALALGFRETLSPSAKGPAFVPSQFVQCSSVLLL